VPTRSYPTYSTTCLAKIQTSQKCIFILGRKIQLKKSKKSNLASISRVQKFEKKVTASLSLLLLFLLPASLRVPSFLERNGKRFVGLLVGLDELYSSHGYLPSGRKIGAPITQPQSRSSPCNLRDHTFTTRVEAAQSGLFVSTRIVLVRCYEQ
jgi:hypothetical protein